MINFTFFSLNFTHINKREGFPNVNPSTSYALKRFLEDFFLLNSQIKSKEKELQCPMRKIVCCLFFLFSFSLQGAWGHSLLGEKVFTIAIQNTQGCCGEDSFIQYSARYLKRTFLGTSVEIVLLPLNEIERLAGERKLDFAFLSPDGYAIAERHSGARVLASEMSPFARSGKEVTGATLVALKNENQTSLIEKLKKTPVAVRSDSATIQKIITSELETLGITKPQFLEIHKATPEDDLSLLSAVKEGKAAAALFKACDYEGLVIRDPSVSKSFKAIALDGITGNSCVATSSFYPGWAFVSLIPSPKEEHLLASALFGISTGSFRDYWIPPVSYNSVENLLSTIKDSDYLDGNKKSFFETLKDYWEFFAVVFFAALALIIHSVRTQVLINRRTDELIATVRAKKEVEKKAQEYNERLSAIERSGVVSEISSMIAHELKQPLAVIHNYAHGLSRSIEKGISSEEKTQMVIAKIDAQSKKASDIIEHVRAYAKKKAKEFELINFSLLCEQSTRNFELTHNRSVHLEITQGIEIYADFLEVELVIFNLLKNAAEASSNVADPKIELRLSVSGVFAKLEIRDNGPVLSDEEFNGIGQPLKTGKSSGLGLGLQIVKRIVEAAKGSIEFKRIPQGGVAVETLWPLAKKSERV